jgi:hypothetical protein
MKLGDLLSLIAAVSAAPLLDLGLLNPTMTSVQNVQGSNYSGLMPPPWITGGSLGGPWGQPYGPPPYNPNQNYFNNYGGGQFYGRSQIQPQSNDQSPQSDQPVSDNL